MKALLLLPVLFLSGCALGPTSSLASWDGKNGKVRQQLFGPRVEDKIESDQEKMMADKCPGGYTVSKIGSDLHTGPFGSAEAKTKEFTCK